MPKIPTGGGRGTTRVNGELYLRGRSVAGENGGGGKFIVDCTEESKKAKPHKELPDMHDTISKHEIDELDNEGAYQDAINRTGIDARSIRKRNIENEPNATELVRSLASSPNVKVSGMEFRIKTEKSHKRKVITRANMDIEYTGSDEVRYTILSTSDDNFAKEAKDILKNLKKSGHKIVDFENRYADSDKGYRDISLVIENPTNGAQFELQINTESMAEAKTLGHPIYEKQRKHPKNSPEWRRYETEMCEIYNSIKNPKGTEKVIL
jgi:hypothetical protein